MRQILFVQGGGEGAHDEWDAKLVATLMRELGSGYKVHYPLMPNEASPDYAKWSAAIRREITSLGDGAILVGHSIGATILINALTEKPPKQTPGGIFLVAAPFIGDGGWPSDEIHPNPHLGEALPEGAPVFLYHGDKDETAPIGHVDLYTIAIPQARVLRLKGRDHQLNEDLSEVAQDILSLP